MSQIKHEIYMRRCLELAQLGKGSVSPNPMVGAVIVHNNQIIGEGYHEKFGGPHAEVNAVNSVANKSLLKQATIYVSLEPCSHFGKTPPCADLIIKHEIPKVVVSTLDTHQVVCGNGIAKLKNAGIEVIVGVLENESKHINRAFNKFQFEKKPWVILKWAQTADGFIDHHRKDEHEKPLKISSNISSTYVHKIRSEVDAILVGKNTVTKDNPSLNTRKWKGKNPIRVIIDPQLSLDHGFHIFDNKTPTIIFNNLKNESAIQTEFIQIAGSPIHLIELLDELGKKNIQSILVEGGAFTLQKFIDSNLYDECIVLKSENSIGDGIKAPKVTTSELSRISLGTDTISYYA